MAPLLRRVSSSKDPVGDRQRLRPNSASSNRASSSTVRIRRAGGESWEALFTADHAPPSPAAGFDGAAPGADGGAHELAVAQLRRQAERAREMRAEPALAADFPPVRYDDD